MISFLSFWYGWMDVPTFSVWKISLKKKFFFFLEFKRVSGSLLVVQYLGLHAFTAEIRFKLWLSIPQVTRRSRKKKVRVSLRICPLGVNQIFEPGIYSRSLRNFSLYLNFLGIINVHWKIFKKQLLNTDQSKSSKTEGIRRYTNFYPLPGRQKNVCQYTHYAFCIAF